MNWAALLGFVVALVVGYWSASSMMLMSFVDWIMIAVGVYLIYCAYSYAGMATAHRAVLGVIGALIVGYNLRMIM